MIAELKQWLSDANFAMSDGTLDDEHNALCNGIEIVQKFVDSHESKHRTPAGAPQTVDSRNIGPVVDLERPRATCSCCGPRAHGAGIHI